MIRHSLRFAILVVMLGPLGCATSGITKQQCEKQINLPVLVLGCSLLGLPDEGEDPAGD